MSYLTLLFKKKKMLWCWPSLQELWRAWSWPCSREDCAVWRCLCRGDRSFAGTFLGDARAWGLACWLCEGTCLTFNNRNTFSLSRYYSGSWCCSSNILRENFMANCSLWMSVVLLTTSSVKNMKLMKSTTTDQGGWEQTGSGAIQALHLVRNVGKEDFASVWSVLAQCFFWKHCRE